MKLGVVANFAYGAMTSDPSLHVGGVERQVTMLCRWFASRGHDVSLITWDEGYKDNTIIDGVKLIKLCKKDEGLPGLRFFHPRWTSLLSALRHVNADVYYQNCAEYVTGQVALWCKINNKKFIYSVASEPDCDPDLPAMHKLRDRELYKYGLTRSDEVIVQNKKQQQMIKYGFKRKSKVLNMPCKGVSDIEYTAIDKIKRKSVIWVGRIAKVKRPDRLLKIAEVLMDRDFIVAGGADKEEKYAQEIFREAKKTTNVKMMGSVSHEVLDTLYKKSCILCCTSEYEGLPNTFLEAWSYGIPVISTVDPDNILTINRIGVYCESIEEMPKKIEALLSDKEALGKLSGRAREYYIKQHSLNGAMEKFEDLFIDTLRR
ncbi:MAG: glycosyltransferase family 4 protein [Candidatus Thiodiazotropha sp. (ex Monitilora ramsayi)]|nr:glycosyltransferase family 4 protein [Candidatus Thiodiazotropha sp. (ex Monitilora ramsayi)]